jgi:collagenase-like PrtC family protease
MNRKALYRELGITDYTAPVELNYQELRTLGIEDSDLIVYGYQPVMVSAQCLFENTKGCRKQEQGTMADWSIALVKAFLFWLIAEGATTSSITASPYPY